LIPVLVDDSSGHELVLYETAALCLHLCDTHPAAGLAPAPGTTQRAHFYKWLVWLTNTLQATLIHYFYPERLVDDGDAGAAAQVRAHAQARVGLLLEQIDAQLASHDGPWFLGDDYSAVDPYAFMLCRWTRGFSSRPAREYTHIAPYLHRVLARPAMQAALAAEEISAPFY
jgi:glutathione S-transferase